MPRLTLPRLRLALAFGLATAALIAGLASEAASAASVVGPNGQINGCYKKKGKAKGTVRVVPTGKRCRRGEKPISWSSQGPQGQGGTQGGTGSAGDAGLESQITELQSQVSQLTSQVTALTSELSGLTDQVTTLTTTVDSVCSELGTVVTETNGILTGLGAPSLTGTLLGLGSLGLSFPSLPTSLSPYSCP